MIASDLKVAAVDVQAERRSDGSILLSNGIALPPVNGTIPQRLAHWANIQPQALFLTQGDRELTYAQAEAERRRIAARLLAMPLSLERPLMLLGQNSIEHALVVLAATSVGIPVAIVSPTYAAPEARPWAKLLRVIGEIDPGLVIADHTDLAVSMLAESGRPGLEVRSLKDLGWIDAVQPISDTIVDAMEADVGLDTVAKLLFTSGSTGHPKAVANTQRMMVSNMLGLSAIWPFLNDRPPVSVDWLPWNHTFGGNCCFNTTLWFGGHSHIDDGRPTLKSIAKTVDALRRWRPTLFYNVPVGFEALLPFLESDPVFARHFFGDLDFIFNGGAPLPTALRKRVEAAALASVGRVPMIVAGWGSTETAPFSSILYFDQPYANNLGAPMPGTTIKMMPNEDRYELRVRGPNVMPGYWRDPTTTANAFDEEGFYKIGDAAKFADPNDPSAGILFDGRVAENFKLTSGTWVNVGALRLAIVNAGEKLISDVVITGHGRGEVGILLFPNQEACRALLGEDMSAMFGTEAIAEHPLIRERLSAILRRHNDRQMGSSTRIARFMVLAEPPSAHHDEITEKGNVNQRRILERRADLVERLYEDAYAL
ncbi:trans-feruloyl-CoA synthase [Sphingobium sp. AP50]|nr:trans-feruloyl-CoA synthase [Sphingobium sp. AP50]